MQSIFGSSALFFSITNNDYQGNDIPCYLVTRYMYGLLATLTGAESRRGWRLRRSRRRGAVGEYAIAEESADSRYFEVAKARLVPYLG